MTGKAIDELARLIPGSTALFNEPMTRHTSFKIGGPADLLILPSSVRDLKTCVSFCRESGLPLFVMGNGTNLLVRDKGIRGVVIKIAGVLDEIQLAGETVVVGAGALLQRVSTLAADWGLAGMEFACGIPGAVGGALVMNAGAYGGDMKGIVESVELLSADGRVRSVRGSAMGFGYRSSRLQGSDDIAVSAVLSLKRGDPAEIRERVREFTARREEKQPLDRPSAGSVFRRPEGRFVGPMIEQAGLKGFRIGGAQVSEIHAGFIVNAGGATAADVVRLIEHIQEVVSHQTGVMLVPEVRIVGEE